jgi:hypothetical protein
VLPSDVVEAVGAGNHEMGIAVMLDLFASEPFLSMRAPNILPPQIVYQIGNGDLQAGRKVLNRFVTLARKQQRRSNDQP